MSNPFCCIGISILKGFGFIQYAEEVSAENAIHGGQNIEILAHRIGKFQEVASMYQE